MEDVADYLELAKDVSISAGKLLMSKYKKVKNIRHKAPGDVVTEADLEAEELIVSSIRKKHPGHGFLAEEGGESQGKEDMTWIIDPLDGTNNYTYGLPIFGVSIALVKGKEPVLGVINVPVFGQLFHAVKGRGSFMNGKPIKVSGRDRLQDSMMLYDSDFVKSKTEILYSLDSITKRVNRIRMLGAASVQFVQIAMGNADAWTEQSTNPWDIAAGCLIVEEAGGKVTDFDGKPWNPWMKNLVASNGTRIHGEILELLKAGPR
ncbi:MAG: inositol monophosphatase [Candidatus Aenigmarchaeota archaeon]|nr:inositol monophosphatase [Candidatus Aenigmarchaeota archaeon]